jgi:hypothetical protein
MDMFTNYDAQQVVGSNKKLVDVITELKDVNPGSGECTIHLWALKQLLIELASCKKVVY